MTIINPDNKNFVNKYVMSAANVDETSTGFIILVIVISIILIAESAFSIIVIYSLYHEITNQKQKVHDSLGNMPYPSQQNAASLFDYDKNVQNTNQSAYPMEISNSYPFHQNNVSIFDSNVSQSMFPPGNGHAAQKKSGDELKFSYN